MRAWDDRTVSDHSPGRSRERSVPPSSSARRRAPARERQQHAPALALAQRDRRRAVAVAGERVHVRRQQRQQRPRPGQQRQLAQRGGQGHGAPAAQHPRPRRATARRRAPGSSPSATGPPSARAAGTARRCVAPSSSTGAASSDGPEQELVLARRGAAVARVGERQVAHDRQPAGAVLAVGGGQVGVELRAQLRPAAPVAHDLGVPDLRARAVGDADAVGLGAHHAGHRAQLDPADQQLRRQVVLEQREEAADVRAPGADARQAHREAVGHDRAQAVEAPVDARVAAPDDRRAAGACRSSQSGRSGRRAAPPRARRSGTGSDSRCAAPCPASPRGARVERRVLAEVLHPAVVAVGERLAEQSP